jgi:hypothetical protein
LPGQSVQTKPGYGTKASLSGDELEVITDRADVTGCNRPVAAILACNCVRSSFLKLFAWLKRVRPNELQVDLAEW